MTVSSPTPPSSPLWKQLSNFTNNSPAGLEKLMRLVQALSQIFAEVLIVSSPAVAVQCGIAKSQLALARRYLRFFKFIDSFERSFAAWLTTSDGNEIGLILRVADVGKWTCLGVYFLMEDFTLLDAMGVWSTTWSQPVFLEANKFWFYALSLSLLGSIWTLFFPATTSTASTTDQTNKSPEIKSEKVEENMQVVRRNVTPLVKNIIVDGCDILLPGSILGWIGANPTQVGVAMVLSTLVASQDIWNKAQH